MGGVVYSFLDSLQCDWDWDWDFDFHTKIYNGREGSEKSTELD